MDEGDGRTLLVSSPDEQILAHVASNLLSDRELNVGEMPFRVTEVTDIDPDVGEPGTTGTIETGTGLLIRIPPWRHEEYGLEHPGGDTATFWQPEHSMEPLRNQLESNLDRKHHLFMPDHLPGPSDVDGDLFDGYELIKTFAVPATVTEGVRRTLILSKWRFGYTVRNDHHRRHLNLALDTGLGERNSLGFGFVNLVSQTRPSEREREGADALA